MNIYTFTWFVHFELPFRLKGTEKIHTERFFKFPSNIYSILYDSNFDYIWTCIWSGRIWNPNVYPFILLAWNRYSIKIRLYIFQHKISSKQYLSTFVRHCFRVIFRLFCFIFDRKSIKFIKKAKANKPFFKNFISLFKIWKFIFSRKKEGFYK